LDHDATRTTYTVTRSHVRGNAGGAEASLTLPDYRPLYAFWFGDGDLDDAAYLSSRIDVWFKADPAFDKAVRHRFLATLARAADGACAHWADTLRGSLCLVILFDQIPRNVYRGRADAFRYDLRARELAQATLARDDAAT
jgi:uncharacterized protein (DUF924 family)